MTVDPSHLVIAKQGSFFVGGKQVRACGSFDPRRTRDPDGSGQTYWIDQMYVHYQIPPNPKAFPLVFVHGGGGTGCVWESTPDGRDGFATTFLRQGFSVYVVDLPRGGRSGFAGFDGPLGFLDPSQRIVSERTFRPGIERIWSRWRLGPDFPERFSTQAFPMEFVDEFVKHVRPTIAEDATVASDAIVTLLEKIGPAVLVTHSSSGVFGWLAAGRSTKVRGIVSYEPGFVFPEERLPPPIPLFRGSQPSGVPVARHIFDRLAGTRIQVVYGDNIPTAPVPNLLADDRRAQKISCELFVDALKTLGGSAEMLCLPKVGLRGNSHFMFSDLNSDKVAEQLRIFLRCHGLDVPQRESEMSGESRGY